MDINATLIGQMIAFGIFVWFTMTFVWPMLRAAIDEREQQINEGLQNAEQAKSSLAEAKNDAGLILNEARQQAAKLIEEANKRSTQLIEKAKNDAILAGKREKDKAAQEILTQMESARRLLRKEVAELAVKGAEQILRSGVDRQMHSELLEQLSNQL